MNEHKFYNQLDELEKRSRRIALAKFMAIVVIGWELKLPNGSNTSFLMI